MYYLYILYILYLYLYLLNILNVLNETVFKFFFFLYKKKKKLIKEIYFKFFLDYISIHQSNVECRMYDLSLYIKI